MGNAFHMSKNNRLLEVRAFLTGSDYQVWILEKGRRIYLYEIVSCEASGDDTAAIERVLDRAKADIENDAVIVPVVRSWPEARHLA